MMLTGSLRRLRVGQSRIHPAYVRSEGSHIWEPSRYEMSRVIFGQQGLWGKNETPEHRSDAYIYIQHAQGIAFHDLQGRC